MTDVARRSVVLSRGNRARISGKDAKGGFFAVSVVDLENKENKQKIKTNKQRSLNPRGRVATNVLPGQKGDKQFEVSFHTCNNVGMTSRKASYSKMQLCLNSKHSLTVSDLKMENISTFVQNQWFNASYDMFPS